jgi:methyl-accepting chemotaxis protein
VTALNHQFEPDLSSRASPSDAAKEQGTVPKSNWFRQLSVVGKLRLGVLGNTMVLALLAAILLGGTWLLGQGGNAQAIIASIEVRANNAAIALVDVEKALEVAEQAETPSARSAAITQASQELDRAYEYLSDPIEFAGDAMPAEFGPTVEELRSDVDRLRNELVSVRSNASTVGELRSRTANAYDKISTFAIEFHEVSASRADILFARISNTLIAFVLMTVIGVVVSLLVSRHIITDVTGMIRRLTSSMNRVAEGETHNFIPGTDRQDELGAMARALEVFRHSTLELSELTERRASEVEEQLAQQQLTSEEMRALRQQKSQLLEDLANGFEVSVGELITSVSAASEQLKATSSQMVKVADGSNEQADSASAAMKSASSNVTAAAAATDEFALSINEISQQATASATLARDATSLVASANTRMDDLSSAAEEVGEIAGLIQTIAQRTNLLALNASIEAARGGESGRGFAVVASEVKELAMQTSAATSSVAEKISAMQESTRSSASDLGSIYDQIGELEKVAVVIATAVDQQSVSGEELARNIDTVAEGSRQVSERLVALREASEDTGAAAGDVVASANALGTHANDLREKAGRFIADVRKSARDLELGEKAA